MVSSPTRTPRTAVVGVMTSCYHKTRVSSFLFKKAPASSILCPWQLLGPLNDCSLNPQQPEGGGAQPQFATVQQEPCKQTLHLLTETTPLSYPPFQGPGRGKLHPFLFPNITRIRMPSRRAGTEGHGVYDSIFHCAS